MALFTAENAETAEKNSEDGVEKNGTDKRRFFLLCCFSISSLLPFLSAFSAISAVKPNGRKRRK